MKRISYVLKMRAEYPLRERLRDVTGISCILVVPLYQVLRWRLWMSSVPEWGWCLRFYQAPFCNTLACLSNLKSAVSAWSFSYTVIQYFALLFYSTPDVSLSVHCMCSRCLDGFAGCCDVADAQNQRRERQKEERVTPFEMSANHGIRSSFALPQAGPNARSGRCELSICQCGALSQKAPVLGLLYSMLCVKGAANGYHFDSVLVRALALLDFENSRFQLITYISQNTNTCIEIGKCMRANLSFISLSRRSLRGDFTCPVPTKVYSSDFRLLRFRRPSLLKKNTIILAYLDLGLCSCGHLEVHSCRLDSVFLSP